MTLSILTIGHNVVGPAGGINGSLASDDDYYQNDRIKTMVMRKLSKILLRLFLL